MERSHIIPKDSFTEGDAAPQPLFDAPSAKTVLGNVRKEVEGGLKQADGLLQSIQNKYHIL